jgi:hypothetical protein
MSLPSSGQQWLSQLSATAELAADNKLLGQFDVVGILLLFRRVEWPRLVFAQRRGAGWGGVYGWRS